VFGPVKDIWPDTCFDGHELLNSLTETDLNRAQKRSYRGDLALLFVASSGVNAQIPKVDNSLLFHYVKYMERWPADSDLTASAPKVALAVPGRSEVTVERTRLGRVVGQHGKHFLKGDPFAINDKPFEARIARLKRQASPSIGPADVRRFESAEACATCVMVAWRL
jgi:hypothetical protein